MTPLRVLAVGDDGSALMDGLADLNAHGLEVFRAFGATSGLVLLGRVRPDVVLLDLTSEGKRAEHWRRALLLHRRGHLFGVLLISPSANLQKLFSEVADLGVHARYPNGTVVLEKIRRWGGDAEPLSRAG